jgi:hypothetical protein
MIMPPIHRAMQLEKNPAPEQAEKCTITRRNSATPTDYRGEVAITTA